MPSNFDHLREAMKCRRQALELMGRPEERILLKIAREFELLSKEGTKGKA